MESLLSGLVPLALFGVAVILMLGLWNMMKAGSPNRSQNLMRARVIFQFIAILLAMGLAFWSGLG